MGTGYHGGFGKTFGSRKPNAKVRISENAEKMKKQYPLTKMGFFGEKGKHTRVIVSTSPEKTSLDFYQRLCKGADIKQLENKKGRIATFSDGTKVVHRLITKTVGSPAVDIKIIGSSDIKTQKIHFIKGDK